MLTTQHSKQSDHLLVIIAVKSSPVVVKWTNMRCNTRILDNLHAINAPKRKHNFPRCSMATLFSTLIYSLQSTSYKYENNLNAHKKIHQGFKEHACSICNYQTNNRWDLQSHINARHTQLFPCDVCDKRFSTMHRLKVSIG